MFEGHDATSTTLQNSLRIPAVFFSFSPTNFETLMGPFSELEK